MCLCVLRITYYGNAPLSLLSSSLTFQPEKMNPGLTPMDWVLFISTAVGGLVSLCFNLLTLGF